MGLLRIHASSPIEHIEIYNLLGNRLFGQYANSTEMTIDLSSFPNGFYLLRTSQGKSQLIIKN
jgi:hypothetical protein